MRLLFQMWTCSFLIHHTGTIIVPHSWTADRIKWATIHKVLRTAAGALQAQYRYVIITIIVITITTILTSLYILSNRRMEKNILFAFWFAFAWFTSEMWPSFHMFIAPLHFRRYTFPVDCSILICLLVVWVKITNLSSSIQQRH